jgi:hypothetical protein
MATASDGRPHKKNQILNMTFTVTIADFQLKLRPDRLLQWREVHYNNTTKFIVRLNLPVSCPRFLSDTGGLKG